MTNDDFLAIINAEPENVKTSEDGSYKFVPISQIQKKLDEVFGGTWGWDLQREFWGRGYATGKGVLTYQHPVTGQMVSKGGTAGIVVTKQITMDYPKLEAQVLLNAAKKIGRAFGRDLNRDKEDAPLPVIEVERMDEDVEGAMDGTANKLLDAATREEAQDILNESGFRFNAVFQKIVANKPPKNG